MERTVEESVETGFEGFSICVCSAFADDAVGADVLVRVERGSVGVLPCMGFIETGVIV